MKLDIRPETPADIDAIDIITRAAFQNEEYSSHTEQFIVKSLRNAGQLSLSLVAEADGKVVGHVAISPVLISDKSLNWFGLGPLSVVPEYQNQGIGSLLMERALATLKQHHAAGCVLLGEPDYYGRFGFKAFQNLVLDGGPPEYFQALPFGDEIPTGSVSYHEAFLATE